LRNAVIREGETDMDRRAFIKVLPASIAGIVALLSLGGCAAPLVSSKVWDPGNGSPWLCRNCGHLTRSDKDLTNTRCPRCGQRMLARISEDEMEQRLKVVKVNQGA